MPRGAFDLDIDQVRASAIVLNITEPCAVDNNHSIGDRFQMNGVWPIYYLFDAERKFRRSAAGAFGLRVIEPAIARLFDTR